MGIRSKIAVTLSIISLLLLSASLILRNASKEENYDYLMRNSVEVEAGIQIGREAVLEYLDRTGQIELSEIHIDLDTLITIENEVEDILKKYNSEK
jgi:hypothetical protein